MLTDASPTSYTYEDIVLVLKNLDFELAPHGGGSHRKWRRRSANGNIVVIGLVERGTGALKAYLVRDMVHQLQRNGLIPADLEQE